MAMTEEEAKAFDDLKKERDAAKSEAEKYQSELQALSEKVDTLEQGKGKDAEYLKREFEKVKEQRDKAKEELRQANEAKQKFEQESATKMKEMLAKQASQAALLELGVPVELHRFIHADIPLGSLELDESGALKEDSKKKYAEWIETSPITLKPKETDKKQDEKNGFFFRPTGANGQTFLDEKGNVNQHALRSQMESGLKDMMKQAKPSPNN